MITKPIVFVLGAGASHCYEFPLGTQLCEMVIKELQKNGPTYQLLEQNGNFLAENIDKFRTELSLSGQNSIDAFLETRHEYLVIGKAAMSTILIRYEKPAILWRFDRSNWMRYLYERMRAPTLEKFAENKVAFITFNFDRSLEHFLQTSLLNTYGASVEDCANVMSTIPIIHLHGRLGYLPWQHEPSRPYSKEQSYKVLRMCIDSIKLVHEELKDGRDKDFEYAKRVMQAADKNYLLGFGFSELNVERLGLKDLAQNKAIATAIGFTQAEADAISRKISSSTSIYPNLNIESLFRELVNWE